MRCIICLIFISSFIFMSSARAQESMSSNISYPLLAKLIDTAKAYYPKYKVYQRRVNIAMLDLKKEKRGWFDALNFSFVYSPGSTTTLINNPSFLNGYQFGLGLNLGTLLQRPSTIKQSKEKLEIAKLDKNEYDLALEVDVKQRYFAYIQSSAVLRLVTRMALDAESISKELKYKFEKSEETFERYNKALIDEAQQKQKAIESEGNVLMAKARLEELLGKRLEDIK